MNCPICGYKLPVNTYSMLHAHLTGANHLLHYDQATLITGLIRNEGKRMQNLTKERIDAERKLTE